MSPAQLRLIETVRGHLRRALDQDWRDATYARGAAGQLLALAALDELAVARGAPPSLDAGWLAERLARLLSQLPRYPHGLFQGVQGLLFAALELDRVHALGMAEEMARDADEHLMECLRSGEGLPEHFDLIGGLSGLLVYAAYREQQGGDLPLAEACLRRLAAQARPDGAGGLSWFTPAAWIRGFPMGDVHPTGCTDLGVAHGQAGVLAALAYAQAVGASGAAQGRELLLGSVQTLRRHEQQGGPAHFGVAAEEAGGSRCAWCYGDLGMAAALQLSAQALADPGLEAWVERLLQSLSRRPLPSLGFSDAWLCHGSIGSAWLLRQLAPQRAEMAARFQRQHALEGEGGLLAALEADAAPDLSLLEGHAGLALVLAELGQDLTPALHWSLPFLAGRRALQARASAPA
ncbi:lanthionine synthetase LanC family protein [Pelomonas sp. BJYL3]|uniref:lanthionine synthetase LanC family protein n=1 Tax=Pelomonas sp. BJYL3 TaxID=2976697 RepID=UPI0022B51D92|nr:lanthionine synthetase LanC family protein [Pelomonas sp. BJYL3]